MLKFEELTTPTSCLNNARMFEMTFVLLGRDPAAAVAIRAWIEARIKLDKNRPDDPQMLEAEACAQRMERESALHERIKRLVQGGSVEAAYERLLEFYREEAKLSGVKLEERNWVGMCVDAKLMITKLAALHLTPSSRTVGQ